MAKATTDTQGTGGSKIRVSQATIDKIKKMGMTKALAGAKSANPEMKEALTRMYGAKRVSAAGSSSAKYTSPDAARAANAPARFKTADAARSSVSTKTTTKPTPKPKAKPTQTAFGVSVADWRKAYGAPATTPKPKVKTAAQKAAEAKVTAARRKAAAAAMKAANGRTH
jgi:hypothetical protein